MLSVESRTNAIIDEYQTRLSNLVQTLNREFRVPKATPSGTDLPDLFRMIGIGHAEMSFHQLLDQLDDDIENLRQSLPL